MIDVDLADLAAFAAVSRVRSFRRAAAVRGVSASSLSEALRRLEARLGVRLLNRTTRSVTPTEAGQRLLQRLEPALGEVSAAIDEVNSLGSKPTGTVRLNVPLIVARLTLPPIIGRFAAKHPGISFDVSADDNFIDVLAAGSDAGIRYDERLDLDMVAVPIGPRRQRFATAAAPAYLAAHEPPLHPRDLLCHACIRHKFTSGVTVPWEFERDGQAVKVNPPGLLTTSSLDLELAAALQGLGIISTFEECLAPALQSGALVPLLSDWWQSFSGPFLYYPGRRHLPAPLRTFVDFVKAGGGSQAG